MKLEIKLLSKERLTSCWNMRREEDDDEFDVCLQ